MTDRNSAGAAPTQVVDLVYDALGRLTAKVRTSGGQTSYEISLWDGDHVLMRLEASPSNMQGPGGGGRQTELAYRVSHRYLHGPMVDMVLAEETYSSASGPVVAGSGGLVTLPPEGGQLR